MVKLLSDEKTMKTMNTAVGFTNAVMQSSYMLEIIYRLVNWKDQIRELFPKMKIVRVFLRGEKDEIYIGIHHFGNETVFPG